VKTGNGRSVRGPIMVQNDLAHTHALAHARTCIANLVIRSRSNKGRSLLLHARDGCGLNDEWLAGCHHHPVITGPLGRGKITKVAMHHYYDYVIFTTYCLLQLLPINKQARRLAG
jgi:hypothetical protein